MSKTKPVAQTTRLAYALVNPDEALPSGDPRYVPLDEARGTKNAAQSLADRITALDSAVEQAGRREFARFLVTGHSGCGKTTELNRRKDLLSRANGSIISLSIKSAWAELKTVNSSTASSSWSTETMKLGLPSILA